jgi:hypothetical protein
MAEELKKLLREYEGGRVSRREFMRQAVIMTGSLAAANSLIGGLLAPHSYAAQVAANDPDVLTHNVNYEGKAGPVAGYLARPMKAGQYPGLIVIHQNRGLDDNIRDVARRFAKEGYVALAPDFLSRQGGTMKVNPKGEGLPNIRELAPWQGVAEDAEGRDPILAGSPRCPPRPNGRRRILLGWGDGIRHGNTGTRPQSHSCLLRRESKPLGPREGHSRAGYGPLR